MNKIFKVVWSKAKNCYVVVSEVAKANGKTSVRSSVGRASLAATMAVTFMLSTSVAMAADYQMGGTYDSVAKFKQEAGFSALAGSGYCNYYPVYTDAASNTVVTTGNVTYTTTEYGGHFGLFGAYTGNKGGGNNITENPNGNTLEVKHDLTVNTGGNIYLYGGCIDTGADAQYNGVATGNSVYVGGASENTPITVSAKNHVFIGGALSNSNANADVDGNTATIENVKFDLGDSVAVVYGAEARGGSATNNELVMTNVTAENANVFGGFVFQKGGDASGNMVTLTDVTFGEGTEIAGGYVYGVDGNADENTVTIAGDSKVEGIIYGGYADNGTASDNVINVKDNADISTVVLSGDNGGKGTGNTLNLAEGWTGKTVGAAENFNEINVGSGVEAEFTQGIKATEDLVVNAQDGQVTIAGNADDGVKAVVYAAEGADLTIHATGEAEESLTIENKGTASGGAAVLAVGAVDTTKVALDGNIDIDANGGRGVKAQNVYNSTDTSAVVDLGGDATESITVKNAFIGLGAHYNGSQINVVGDALTIEDATGYGIYAMNGTTDDANLADNAKISIDADTVTTVTMADGSYGAISAQSQGTVEIAGDLYATADDVITARGNGTVKVNEANDDSKTVQLDGDITFNYDATTSGSAVDAGVYVNLANDASYLNGNIFVTGDDIPEGYDDVTGMNLGLANGAQWTTEGSADSFVNNLTMDGGTINQESTGEITIDNLSGTGNVVFADGSGQVNVLAAESGATLNLSMAGTDADSFNTTDDLNKVAKQIDVAQDATSNITGNVHVDEGLLSGAIDMTVDYEDLDGDGRLNGIIKDVQQAKTTVTTESVSGVAANAAVAWREEDATLSQRLGELRNSEGDQGVWARFVQGEFERGNNFETEYNMFQIGYDKAKGDWHYGAAVSHTEGDTSYAAGSGELSNTSLSAYGTWLGDRGHYKDIVAKIGSIDSEYSINAAGQLTKGDYDTYGASISAEYGMKNAMGNGWFVTPLAKMTYMHIGGDSYTTNNGINVKHDAIDSLIARLGVELGKELGKKGAVYVKASALHDFCGDADTAFSLGNNSALFTDEIGGTWYEVGFGFNYKVSDATNLYADVIKTYGDEIRTPWQWNAGVRYSF